MSAFPIKKEGYPSPNTAEQLEGPEVTEGIEGLDSEFAASFQETQAVAEETPSVSEIPEPGEQGRLTEQGMIDIDLELSEWQRRNTPGDMENAMVFKQPSPKSDLGKKVARMRVQRREDRAIEREKRATEQSEVSEAGAVQADQQRSAEASWSTQNKSKGPDAPPIPEEAAYVKTDEDPQRTRVFSSPEAASEASLPSDDEFAAELDQSATQTKPPQQKSTWGRLKGLFGGGQ
jgi:hypothetical protein